LTRRADAAPRLSSPRIDEDRARLLGGFAGGSSGPLRQVGMLASLGRSLLLRFSDSLSE